jgi:hypothetical protein
MFTSACVKKDFLSQNPKRFAIDKSESPAQHT